MTSALIIPDWSIQGTLPPIRPGTDATSTDRSPYPASPLDLCLRLGQTAERRYILRGLLDLRAELRTAGLGDGFQWSHRRADERRKGFVELSLSDVDAHAGAWLDRHESVGVTGEAQDEQ